jgi:serine protease Do
VLTGLSDALSGIVAAATPLLTSIRVGPESQQPGLVWRENLVVTAEAGLPPGEACCLVLPGGAVQPGRVILRNAASGVAAIALADPVSFSSIPLAGPTRPGALAVLLGTTPLAQPTARLVMVHSVGAPEEDPAADFVLDVALPADAAGGPVLDAGGHLLGMALGGPGHLTRVVPHATLSELFPGGPAVVRARRGWLGLSLQPVATEPGFAWLRSSAPKGRRVVAVAGDSPGAVAGIAVGDTLLAINGRPINGQHSLREFLAEEQIGRTIELQLVHNDKIRTRRVTIAARPED